MKKVFIKAAIVISVLLLIFKGFLMFRNYTSYKNVIHKDANKIVKIHVDGIIKSMAYNAIKNPSYYYNNSKKDKDTIDEPDKKGKGFGIPANVFLYTIKGKSESTIFTSFKISNAKDFKDYLKNEHSIYDSHTLKSITVAKSKDENVLVAYNDKQCVIAYNPNKDMVDNVFTDVLSDHKTLRHDNTLFSKLKDTDAHISFIAHDDVATINFNDGAVVIKGNILLPEHIKIPTETTLPQFSDHSSVTFYMNMLSTKTQKKVTFKSFDIELDSINRYYKGSFALETAGSTTQIDSIVTYEYNDDFEKVEAYTLSEKQIPEITVQLSANSKGLMNYLENTNIINSGMLNKAAFPLYQVKIDTTAMGLQASTNLVKSLPTKRLSHTECFALNVDFEKLKEQNQFPIITPFLGNLIHLKLKGSTTSGSNLQVEGKVQLKNENINAIAQLIFQKK